MLNIKNIIFTFAIFILTMFVGIYGISTVFGNGPEYPNPYNEEICLEMGGVWITDVVSEPSDPVRQVPFREGYCQYDYMKFQKEFEEAQERHYRKVFFTAIPLAIVIILAGAMLFGLEAVGAGLMLGGVGLIIYGTGSYWRFTDDWLKFLLSLVGLVILIYGAYWFNSKDKSFFKRLFTKDSKTEKKTKKKKR
jgi:hypothetical protein